MLFETVLLLTLRLLPFTFHAFVELSERVKKQKSKNVTTFKEISLYHLYIINNTLFGALPTTVFDKSKPAAVKDFSYTYFFYFSLVYSYFSSMRYQILEFRRQDEHHCCAKQCCCGHSGCCRPQTTHT